MRTSTKLFLLLLALMAGITKPVFAQSLLDTLSSKHTSVVRVMESAGCVVTRPLLMAVLQASDIKPSQVRRLRVGTKVFLPAGVTCGNAHVSTVVTSPLPSSVVEVSALNDSLTEVNGRLVTAQERASEIDRMIAEMSRKKDNSFVSYGIALLSVFLLGAFAMWLWQTHTMVSFQKDIWVKHEGEKYKFTFVSGRVMEIHGSRVILPAYLAPCCNEPVPGGKSEFRTHLVRCPKLRDQRQVFTFDPAFEEAHSAPQMA